MDIVVRLRQRFAPAAGEVMSQEAALVYEAADEIEKLRARNQELERLLSLHR